MGHIKDKFHDRIIYDFYDNIIEHNNYPHDDDEEFDYYDFKHEWMDKYLMFKIDAQEIVESYGTYKAIQLNKDNYGKIDYILENENKFWKCLCKVVILYGCNEDKTLEKYWKEKQEEQK